MEDYLNSLPIRHALKRAYFFLGKAELCTIEERDHFECYIEASIIFARAALHRLKSTFEGVKGWKEWFDTYLEDDAVKYFKNHRDFILKEGPPKIAQIIGSINSVMAKDMYYFEHPKIPATLTIRKHLEKIAQIDQESHEKFNIDNSQK